MLSLITQLVAVLVVIAALTMRVILGIFAQKEEALITKIFSNIAGVIGLVIFLWQEVNFDFSFSIINAVALVLVLFLIANTVRLGRQIFSGETI